MTRTLHGRVLIIAGSDSSGGAGIQADIKAVTAMGAYAATAITALTAQNTTGVYGVFGIPPDFVAQQIDLVLSDVGADCIKIGMLHDVPTINAVADALTAGAAGIPVVLDPVMVAKGGASLLEDEAVSTLRQRLLSLAHLITPNAPEAAALLGRPVQTAEAQQTAAQALRELGPQAVLLKGGHIDGSVINDVLAQPDGLETFSAKRIDTAHTHGTGCTLASAIAAGLAQNMPLGAAIERAQAYVHAAIETAPGFGRGHGPLNHLATTG